MKHRPEAKIRCVGEGDLRPHDERAVVLLLEVCFPLTFEGRSYFKQLPHARLLMELDVVLIGHLGLDLRVIRVGQQILRTLGVIDLCIDPGFRGQRLATKLLEAAQNLARSWRADFMLLFADEPQLYSQNGFYAPPAAEATWLAIEDRSSHSKMERDLSGTLMIKPLSDKAWPAGPIDLLGYLF